MEGFSIGDVVTLKSGGPVMTIEGDEGGECVCVWFEGSEVKRGAFPPVTLMKHDEAGGFAIG